LSREWISSAKRFSRGSKRKWRDRWGYLSLIYWRRRVRRRWKGNKSCWIGNLRFKRDLSSKGLIRWIGKRGRDLSNLSTGFLTLRLMRWMNSRSVKKSWPWKGLCISLISRRTRKSIRNQFLPWKFWRKKDLGKRRKLTIRKEGKSRWRGDLSTGK
jgi:hypothetical protein